MANSALKRANESAKNRIIGISAISVIALALAAILIVTLVLNSGGTVMENGDLMKTVHASRNGSGTVTDDFKSDYTDFCLSTISNYTSSTENVAFSLTNAMSATAFLTYGANGETAKELEKVLGTDALGAGKSLSKIEKAITYSKNAGCGLKSSTTAWLNNSALFAINKSFLKTNGKYFGLGVYRDSFADNGTQNKAQSKVSKATNGNTFPVLTFEQTQYMNIVSGSSFIGKWKNEASETDLHTNLFKGALNEQISSFFRCVESRYINAGSYSGIIKDFDGDFSFVALSPKRIDENSGYYDMSDVINELHENGSFKNFAKAAIKKTVAVTLPNYSNSVNVPTTTDLSEILKSKNVEQVFKKTADMKNIAENSLNLHLDNFVTSGDISITPAGSCSAVSTGKDVDEKKFEDAEFRLDFNHSFIYFIVDNNSGLPVYFGILNNIE